MAVTIDPRPTYFGDRIIVTGSYQAGDVSIDLSSLMTSIDAIIVNPNTTVAQPVDTTAADDGGTEQSLSLLDTATFSGTTINLAPASDAGANQTVAGTFLAIGRR
jgi:hypothetical protein